ncbi:hypothetical protein EG359_20530 [Chryseobacterium joostei]|uniref:DUF4369 domain-containing protein n=1 Tax=Chryseobacterium joostei TaxID=112234 RepID=A0A1N7IBQ6_9FLAO|nr:hypothetical protein [Chryseobacterium joostei]AZB01830.1 hypothetical protein EG359_20530 [Chryseobacterium joostei]SIS34508.1 hypothetical protein SAMN05421768_1046 [Chryseobacterium joostei]
MKIFQSLYYFFGQLIRPPFPLFFAKAFPKQKNELHSGRVASDSTFQNIWKLAIAIILTLFISCNSSSFYHNVNDMGGQPATLYLNNGKVLNGKLEIRSFDEFSSVQKITFKENSSNTYQWFYPQDIAGIYFNGAKYSLELVQAMDMWNKRAYKFLKNITPNDGNLQLFEDEYTQKNSFGDIERITKLYIKLARSNEVFDAQSDRFVPNFNEKVSRFLSDCPSVSQKILNKEKDFSYAFVNQGETQRKQVWMNIAFEYNLCK